MCKFHQGLLVQNFKHICILCEPTLKTAANLSTTKKYLRSQEFNFKQVLLLLPNPQMLQLFFSFL